MITTRKDTSILRNLGIPTTPITFTKMSGSGNDFIFINLVAHPIADEFRSEIAVLLAERRMSVGADGVIFLEPLDTSKGEFKWYFYNNDGSVAEMCGNGSRCAFAYARAQGWLNDDGTGTLHTIAGLIQGQAFDERNVRIRMVEYRDYNDNVTLHAEGAVFVGATVDTGVPHVIVQVDDVDNFDVHTYGAGIRNHPLLAPRGSNVNFMERVDNIHGATSAGGGSLYRVRTFERGVEAETLACGTGFSAVGVHLVLSGRCTSPVAIKTSCGDIVWVAVEPMDNNHKNNTGAKYNIYLRGDVDFIYDATLRLT